MTDSIVPSFDLIIPELSGSKIRRTEDGHYSIYDLIRIVGGKKNPHDAWKRLIGEHPELKLDVKLVLIEGDKSKKLTPVASEDTAKKIARIAQSPRHNMKESRIEDAFCNQYDVRDRQYILPSGKRVDVILQDGTVCEIKQGKATSKALSQLLGYLSELNHTKGWIVAERFSQRLIAKVDAILKKGNFNISLVLAPSHTEESLESLQFLHSEEYRDMAVKLLVAEAEGNAFIGLEMILRDTNQERRENAIKRVLEALS
jgi:hypothetical protein